MAYLTGNIFSTIVALEALAPASQRSDALSTSDPEKAIIPIRRDLTVYYATDDERISYGHERTHFYLLNPQAAQVVAVHPILQDITEGVLSTKKSHDPLSANLSSEQDHLYLAPHNPILRKIRLGNTVLALSSPGIVAERSTQGTCLLSGVDTGGVVIGLMAAMRRKQPICPTC